MACSRTVTETQEKREADFDRDVSNSVREALEEDSGIFWTAIQKFMDWLRTKVKDFLFRHLQSLPVVGEWASRIGTSISEFCFTILGTMLNMLKVIFTAPKFWKKAHETAMRAWNANAINGLMAQTYAYSKKMAGYFLEVIKQCLERAIKAHGLEMSAAEKDDISSTLDELLDDVKR